MQLEMCWAFQNKNKTEPLIFCAKTIWKQSAFIKTGWETSRIKSNYFKKPLRIGFWCLLLKFLAVNESHHFAPVTLLYWHDTWHYWMVSQKIWTHVFYGKRLFKCLYKTKNVFRNLGTALAMSRVGVGTYSLPCYWNSCFVVVFLKVM